jgi:hypothetical protein
MRTIGHAVLLTWGVLLLGCGDEPTLPSEALPAGDAPQPVSQNPVSLNAMDRASLKAALLWTGEQSSRALKERSGASRIAAAFAEVARRVEADDRVGAEWAIAGAREAVKRYRELPGTAAAGADLEAMELTLEVASLFNHQLASAALPHSAGAPQP